jgi:hypothetical protein
MKNGLCWGAILLMLLMAAPAFAHDHYDADCCGGEDCRSVFPGEIEEVPGGWRVVRTGEIINERSEMRRPDGSVAPMVRPSRDGAFHICQYDDVRTFSPIKRTRCLYVPLGV